MIIVFILKAAQCIPWSVIRDGITGGGELVQPFNILLFFFSLAYMAMSLGTQTPSPRHLTPHTLALISLGAYPLTVLDLTGVLQSAAFWVSNRGGTSGRKLYIYFYLMTTALSAVLGNDPVILSGTAFLVYFTKIAEVGHTAWIFAEFVTCNTASMLLFVGIIIFYPCWAMTDGRKSNECCALRRLFSQLPRLQRVHRLPLYRL